MFDLFNPNDSSICFFSGFGYERQQILEFAKNESLNMIILGGDLHDSFAWKLPITGLVEGEHVAVNYGCPGVSSPGFGPLFNPVMAPIEAALGGEQARYDAYHAAYYRTNPNLVFTDVQHKGFFVAVATPDKHTVEYFGFDHETMLSDYSLARSKSGGLTAETKCLTSLVTTTPGSLETNADCVAVSFIKERPSFFSMSVETGPLPEQEPVASDCGSTVCMIEFADGKPEEPKPPVEAPKPTSDARQGAVCVIASVSAIVNWLYQVS